jgi:flagellar basal-body rod modification protein FlgD
MANSVNLEQLDSLGLTQKKAAPKKAELGQEQFLQLMTTQLQNQDPLKPMENGDFLGQIAQFSTVSGIQDLQDTFKDLSSSMVSNQALQASSLVGRTVLMPGDSGVFAGEGSVLSGIVDLPNGADDLVVRISDPSGQLISESSLGSQRAGQVQFAWDGQHQDGRMMPPGLYKVTAVAKVGGQEVGSETLVDYQVESVSLNKDQNGIGLNLYGVGPRDFADVREIR